MPENVPCILLVDDEPNNLLLLQELLRSQGYLTRSARSGAEALRMAQGCCPSLILLDVMMPEMDGFEVCQQLRAHEQLRAVPIIFLTALTDDRSRTRGLELLGDDYFTKPVNLDLLLTKITSMLRLSELRQSKQPQRPHPEQERFRRQIDAARRLNEALAEKFRLFVPEQLLARIAPQGLESIRVGNAMQEEVTVLFCDIRDFTTISEAQSADQTLTWLNAFFSRMSQAIETHHGFIDKYLGDAMMAVFDRPKFHAEDAMQAAVRMQKALAEFNLDYARLNLSAPLETGIGIATGQAVIGTVGSAQRMDSTVIGDVVNTAARLEGLTKLYGAHILASEVTIAQLNQPELFHLRWVDCIAPRGKQQQSNLYEVLGMRCVAVN